MSSNNNINHNYNNRLPITCFDCGEEMDTNGKKYMIDVANKGFCLCITCIEKRVKAGKLRLNVDEELRGGLK